MQASEGLAGWVVGPHSIDNRGDRETVDGTLLRAGLGLRVVPYMLEGTDDQGEDRVSAELEWVVTHLATGLVVTRFDGQVGDAIEIVDRIVPLADWAEVNPMRHGLKEDVERAVTGLKS